MISFFFFNLAAKFMNSWIPDKFSYLLNFPVNDDPVPLIIVEPDSNRLYVQI